MVPNNRMSAVLGSTDLARSQDFYEHKVGLRLSTATIKNHLVEVHSLDGGPAAPASCRQAANVVNT